jgi:hypothetical protein
MKLLIKRLLTPILFLGFPFFFVIKWLFWDEFDSKFYKDPWECTWYTFLMVSGWKSDSCIL